MMEMTPVPKLGDDLLGCIVASAGTSEWKVDCPTLPKGWSAKLKSRSAKLYQPGDEGLFWVYGIAPQRKLLFLSDSDFGHLPISDRMRPRYIQALQSAFRLTFSPQDAKSVSPDHLSEVKGMFNRCIRKDQWDWLTVYDALGRPPISILGKAADWFGGLAGALRRGELEQIKRYTELISSLELGGILRKGLARIVVSTPHLNNATSFEPISTTFTEPALGEAEMDSDRYIISQVARAKRERANTSHQRTLQILVKFLESNGFVVERSRLVDAYCRLRTGPAIFEVKSITPDNERSQCRHALSQLYEYRYLHSVPEASLWVVLSDRPRLHWIVDYLQNDRGVGVIWIEGKSLKGPAAARLLESGSAARRREATVDR